jgi:hypothetical protein
MLHNRILLKTEEMQKTRIIDCIDRVWTEFETLQWILSQSQLLEQL